LKLSIPYGSDRVDFEIDKHRLLGVFYPAEMRAAIDQTAQVNYAIRNPIGSAGLTSLLHKGDTVSISCDDATRATPTKLLLNCLLPTIEESGIPRSAVQIVISLGTHRKMTDSELKSKLGEEVIEEYAVWNHAYDDPNELRLLGTIDHDVPVWINRRFLGSSVRICLGNIIPHGNAGWSGGAKSLLPGLAGKETVGRMHIKSAMTTPNALGILDNPTRALIDTYGGKVGIHLILNTVLTRNNQILQAFAGDYLAAHREGVKLSRQVYGVRLPRQADIVISSSYPADLEFWQAWKGIASADLAGKPGGGIVLVTPCPEGISATHPEWKDLLQLDSKTIELMIQKRQIDDLVAAGLALSIVKIRERHRICIISDGISHRDAEKLRVEKFTTIEEAIQELSREYGSDSTLSVLAHGGDMLPIVA
jgi:nickel-dependent lactate racemase